MANKGKIYSKEIIAKVLNLSEKRIKQLSEEGVLEEYSDGFYKLIPAVQNYIKYLQHQISDDDSTSDYNTEKAKYTRAKREEAELDLQFKRNELHRTEDIERMVGNMIIAFRAKLLVLPNKVLPQIINVIDDKKRHELILEILNIEITNILNEFSEINNNELEGE